MSEAVRQRGNTTGSVSEYECVDVLVQSVLRMKKMRKTLPRISFLLLPQLPRATHQDSASWLSLSLLTLPASLWLFLSHTTTTRCMHIYIYTYT